MFRTPCHFALLRSFVIRPPFRPARYYATIRQKPSTTDFNTLSTEAQLEHLDKLILSAENHPDVDIWAFDADLLDLHVPKPVIRAGVGSVSIPSRVKNFFQNQINHFKNVYSMYRIARHNSFPGVQTGRGLSLKMFGVRSTSDKAWVAPLRKIASKTYISVNEALAEGDSKTLKKLTNSGYYAHLQSLLKNRSPNQNYVWKQYWDVKPAKIVSIRAIDGHLGRGVPKFGNRLVIQALVRFDTMQSLEVYSKRGVLMSPESASSPRRVTEYLVLERKMWYDTPWMIKRQLYETS